MVSSAVKKHSKPKSRYSGSALVINVIVLLSVIICIVPLLHILSLSMSGRAPVLAHKITIYPQEIDWSAYISVFSDKSMQTSLVFSIFLTIAYTALAMFLSIFMAYPVSKSTLPGRKVLMIFILIPMYFTAGLIPEYLWVKQLGILNTPWALLLPTLISTYNTIILRNFFASIPESLSESAYLDGCNDFGILFKIVLPLSTASLATIALFYAVTRWNGFNDVLYYINDSKYYTLQMKLYQIVFSSTDTEVSMLEGGRNAVLSDTIKAASIVFSTVPILVVYPFLQKYFVQGVMIGAVKG